jgi:hypothetical protein
MASSAASAAAERYPLMRDWYMHGGILAAALRIHTELKASAQDVAPTLRQVHYQLKTCREMLALPEDQRYTGSDSDSTQLSSKTAELRRAGAFPRFSEAGRKFHIAQWNMDAAEALREIGFRSNRFRDLLDVNVFIGCESAAVVTQLKQWFFNPYHIRVAPLSGNGSQTIIDKLADHAIECRRVYDRPNVLVYCGDFNAKGFDIERDLIERVGPNGRGAFELEDIVRVALTLEQARMMPQHRLKGPARDTTVKAFIDRFDHEAIYDLNENDGFACKDDGSLLLDRDGVPMFQPVSIEMDALPPADLRQAFLDEINRLTDLPDSGDDLTEAEQEEQDKIGVLADLSDRYSLDELRDLRDQP